MSKPLSLSALLFDLISGAIVVEELTELTDLPIYSLDVPEDLVGVYSWDDRRMIIKGAAGYTIVPRVDVEPEEEGEDAAEEKERREDAHLPYVLDLEVA